MKIKRCIAFFVCGIFLLMAAQAPAAFIVEAHSSGLANENFEGGGKESVWSRAAGTTASKSIFSGTYSEGLGTDEYIYSYTPGVDQDNYSPAEGTDFGNGNASTGMIGGETGFYNVYITWPNSTNVGTTCTITVTNDGEDVVNSGIDMNGNNANGNNLWLLIAEGIELTNGQTYTIRQVTDSPNTGVSMRSHGVMWEATEPILAPVTITESDGSTNIEEGGPSDSYTVVLDQQPTSLVYITAQPYDPNNLFLNDMQPGEPVVLTFTPDDWDVPQEITVTAVDDLLVEYDHTVLIRNGCDANSIDGSGAGDPAFKNGFAGYVEVHITDNEAPDVRISETDGSTVVSEAGDMDTYLVWLLFPPTDPVTVTIMADEQVTVDTGAGPGSSATLIFTQNNWDQPQVVTVGAIQDDVLEYVHTGTISHAVSSFDGGYDGLEVDDLIVTIEDDECGAWGFQELDLDEDCVVNLSDFALFAESWLTCTQPYAEGCDDLR
ncbi:MAG: hypothetical protein JXA82_10145 [Sedimentisphaerales bacterium]|nr:hypothetical protein [Sedimentisphaerales bacterium]